MTFALVILAFFVLMAILKFLSTGINTLGIKNGVNNYRIKYITKTVNLVVSIYFLIVMSSFLGLEYSQLTIFLSSAFAVIGVALFAQWSILSNITASLIIFFGFPYRVGDHIRIADKDYDLSGVIEEIALFHVLIRKDTELITYPNALILQKAVIKSPLSVNSDADEETIEIARGVES